MMALEATSRVKTVPEKSFGETEEHLRRVVQSVNALQHGEGNNHFVVLLDANETETRVDVLKVSIRSAVSLTAMSASASLVPGVWAEPFAGYVLIHHPSSPDIDRKFAMVTNG